MSHYLDRSEAVTALRAAADLIESLPFDKSFFVEVEAYGLTVDQLTDAVRLGGKWEKDTAGENGSMFELRQGIVELKADREQVCEARPTGRKVTAKKIVVQPVYEDIEVDEIEWVCAPLLAKAARV